MQTRDALDATIVRGLIAEAVESTRDAVAWVIHNRPAAFQDKDPETPVRNEIELLVVRLLRLACRRHDSANQIALSVQVLQYLNPVRYATLDAESARRWALGLPRDVFGDSTSAVALIEELYDRAHGTSRSAHARALLHQIGRIVAGADGFVSWEEEQVLHRIRGTEPPPPGRAGRTKPLAELLVELNRLVGLGSVKADVQELVNYVRLQQLRRSQKLKTGDVSLHMVFVGNPGTGKTTVARLIAQIYKAMGVLDGGQLVETDRAGLVAGYVGQTALKVDEVVKKALGGVLFIDEAYSLARGGDHVDYGAEAIETLLKRMEDHRDDLVVIVAGYPELMAQFLDANPGLASRFSKKLVFEDYTPEELLHIFKTMCGAEEYVLSSDAESKAAQIFDYAYAHRDLHFGNARFARNLFEHAITNLATRIATLQTPDRSALMTIQPEDFDNQHA